MAVERALGACLERVASCGLHTDPPGNSYHMLISTTDRKQSNPDVKQMGKIDLGANVCAHCTGHRAHDEALLSHVVNARQASGGHLH